MSRQKQPAQFVTILNSCPGPKPLQNWDVCVHRGGVIRRLKDKDTLNLVLEIASPRVSDAFISYPKEFVVGQEVTLPILVLLIKNMMKYLRLQVQVIHRLEFVRGQGEKSSA